MCWLGEFALLGLRPWFLSSTCPTWALRIGRKIISSGTLSVLLGMHSHCNGCQMQLELMKL